MKYDFVAVDFENADNDQLACSVGIVAVKNNVPVEELYHLIQPPGNIYGVIQMNIHKIYPDKTKYSPTFEEIWPEIQKYFSDQHLVMHNAPTDRAILHKSLSYYFLETPEYTYSDTCIDLDCGKVSLDILAKSYNIELENHHNALDDARATAQVWLKHIEGISPDLQIIEEERTKTKKGLFADKKLDPDLYKKDLTNADKSSPFYDRRVVITGDFKDRLEMARKLKFIGAHINSNITRRTHFVIIGDNPGPKKMETLNNLRFDGYSINTLYEEDLERIFDGNLNTKDFVDKYVEKDLKITIEHIAGRENSFKMELNRINLFSGKEIYVCKSIRSRMRVNHLIGYLGAFTNNVLENDVNIILLSDSSIKNLENGIKDEDIELIENTYNSNKSIKFIFQFLSESDFVSYYKHRIENGFKEDEALMEVFDKYIKSLIE